MEYWRGHMNWPLKDGWVCETCGANPGLEWGLVNGQCRCINCHAQYMMRDGTKVVDTPISQLRIEYKAPTKWAWGNLHKPEDELTDEDWDKAFEAVKALTRPESLCNRERCAEHGD